MQMRLNVAKMPQGRLVPVQIPQIIAWNGGNADQSTLNDVGGPIQKGPFRPAGSANGLFLTSILLRTATAGRVKDYSRARFRGESPLSERRRSR